MPLSLLQLEGTGSSEGCKQNNLFSSAYKKALASTKANSSHDSNVNEQTDEEKADYRYYQVIRLTSRIIEYIYLARDLLNYSNTSATIEANLALLFNILWRIWDGMSTLLLNLESTGLRYQRRLCFMRHFSQHHGAPEQPQRRYR